MAEGTIKEQVFADLKRLMAKQTDSFHVAPQPGDVQGDHDGRRETGEFLFNIEDTGGWNIAKSTHLRVYRDRICEVSRDHFSEHAVVTDTKNYTISKFRCRYDSLGASNQRYLARTVKQSLE